MPVLNWDTKAPVDWTGSPLQTLMSRGRGATLVAAALQKSITVPESQANTTAASGSPRVGRAGRSTPEKDKLPMPKRNPPRQKKGTPDKSNTSSKEKKKKFLVPYRAKVVHVQLQMTMMTISMHKRM